MKETENESVFDATPEDAIDALHAHDGPVIVDFDETLYLRNSTSDFIASARPALLAYLLVKVIDMMKPWRRAGDEDSMRDLWRVRMLLIFMPWTLGRWRKQAASSARFALNERLVDGLRIGQRRVLVSTLGFEPIVRPLLDGFGMSEIELVAMDPWQPENVRRGKLELAAEAMGTAELERSAVVTDSLADFELLAAAKVPLRVVWPESGPGETFGRVYYPGRYLTQVKRPGSRYVRKILKEDIALWILCTVWVADDPITSTIGLLFLAISFWAVYETGYVDNDLIAYRHEADPALTEEFRKRKVTFPQWVPLAWAAVCGVFGLLILRSPELPSLLDLVLWAAVLWVSIGIFRLYNRLDKETRILLFPILQLLRTAAFVVVASTLPIAILAIVLHVVMRWISYYVYRTVPGGWPAGAELPVVRLVMFVALGLLLISQGQWSDLWSGATLSLLAWHVFFARREIPAAVASAHRIDKS